MIMDAVAAAIREVGAAEVLPRFRALAEGDVSEKSPGDYVTIADQECERVLSERLRAIRDIPVVGEEATATDPSLLDMVALADAAWIIDPVDGTANFVAGSTDFVIIVALVEHGCTTAGWIWHPETDDLLSAELGQGVRRNGTRLPARPDPGNGTGILKRKYLPEPARSLLAAGTAATTHEVPAQGSAGIEYASLIDGHIDFLFYWRTLPWDHAAGALIVSEAGLRVARPDGSEYQPGDGRKGLLAATQDRWQPVADEINAALTDPGGSG